jgi:anthranilate synthase component 1
MLEAGYEGFVSQLKTFITEGDIIQAVRLLIIPEASVHTNLFHRYLKRPKSSKTDLHPFNAYRTLRRINPSPYMFYVNVGNEFQIVGASPEMPAQIQKNSLYSSNCWYSKRENTRCMHALAQELLDDLKKSSISCWSNT